MTIQSIPSFNLLDNTTTPSKNAIECGHLALESGIRHIDTAQLYKNEKETGEAIKRSSLSREDVYVTSKISSKDNDDPSVEGSIERLGFIPNLYLIHNPFVAAPGELKAMWKILEDLKSQGKLNSIGVSNFRPQDLEAVLDGAKYKPLEYHPYTLAYLQPVLDIQAKHGILTGVRIAARISKVVGKELDSNTVLLLWTRAQGVVVVTTTLGEIATLPNLLELDEIDEITRVGKTIHYRNYTEHMEKDFALPNLPGQ
ncbi:NADP-dependent oxidoreductase domain-containing protein [Flammula alnicola]|nr:NADP-dependent oxidoreductase domain-containing protein [Flammula alnicola]